MELSQNYVSFRDMQEQLTKYKRTYGQTINYPEMTHMLLRTDKTCKQKDESSLQTLSYLSLTDAQFAECVNERLLPIFSFDCGSGHDVMECSIIPDSLDVYMFQQLHNISAELHTHDFFEVVYVYQGECKFMFDDDQHKLYAGEINIIAPDSEHAIEVEYSDSIVFIILIRKSTFDSTFFSLLSRRDLLSEFFRTHLYGDAHANYLRFSTDNSMDVKLFARQLFVNCSSYDSYSNDCCISTINLLFALLLRNYSHTIQLYNYQMGTEFSVLLQYIQNNYRDVSLKQLARIFSYSESHLSVLIKRNTKETFSSLVTRLKLQNAMDYLRKSNMKVHKIADVCGYNSSNHFSRTFKQMYGVSPADYRKEYVSR